MQIQFTYSGSLNQIPGYTPIPTAWLQEIQFFTQNHKLTDREYSEQWAQKGGTYAMAVNDMINQCISKPRLRSAHHIFMFQSVALMSVPVSLFLPTSLLESIN
jgi:hypothetical protein